LLTLLDDYEREDRDIGSDDASTNRLALALTRATGAVARVSVGEEESDTVRKEDTLLHWETLLVVSTRDPNDISLPFVTEGIGRDLCTHTLVIEDTGFSLIVDIKQFLGACGRVGDVELHVGATKEGRI